MKFRKTIVCLLLIAGSAQADIQCQNDKCSKQEVENIRKIACENWSDYESAAKTCNAILKRAEHHLVEEGELNGWCSQAKALEEKFKQDAADYRQASHKKLQFKDCAGGQK